MTTAALRNPAHWAQLLRFCAVGGSGYVVNLAVFFVATERLGSRPQGRGGRGLPRRGHEQLRLEPALDLRRAATGTPASRPRASSPSPSPRSSSRWSSSSCWCPRPASRSWRRRRSRSSRATPLSFVGNRLWSFRLRAARGGRAGPGRRDAGERPDGRAGARAEQRPGADARRRERPGPGQTPSPAGRHRRRAHGSEGCPRPGPARPGRRAGLPARRRRVAGRVRRPTARRWRRSASTTAAASCSRRGPASRCSGRWRAATPAPSAATPRPCRSGSPGSCLFLLPFARPPWRMLHLDLLVLCSLSVSFAFFSDGNVDASVPLAYPPLLYLLARLLHLARASTASPSVLSAWIGVGIVFLLGFRIGLQVRRRQRHRRGLRGRHRRGQALPLPRALRRLPGRQPARRHLRPAAVPGLRPLRARAALVRGLGRPPGRARGRGRLRPRLRRRAVPRGRPPARLPLARLPLHPADRQLRHQRRAGGRAGARGGRPPQRRAHRSGRDDQVRAARPAAAARADPPRGRGRRRRLPGRGGPAHRQRLLGPRRPLPGRSHDAVLDLGPLRPARVAARRRDSSCSAPRCSSPV